ncbi:protein KTI12 homolog [Dreissena polymorpha]|uniref:protein KTI12 homolog n=1 Tax=Dreissena polymorpha TaxID=45954 RepID=UPI0022649AB0|nr:protein KTI12 homolog [Dreissena polymorpha]
MRTQPYDLATITKDGVEIRSSIVSKNNWEIAHMIKKIFCDTSKELASEWNNSRAEEEKYVQEIFDGLVQRFEEPRSNNHWDSPLFVIQKDDVLPLDAISDALLKKKAPAPNASTAPLQYTRPSTLAELQRLRRT